MAEPPKTVVLMMVVFVVLFIIEDTAFGMSPSEKTRLKDQVLEMFRHAYDSYMNYAYPADELMPLSCKGRYRGTKPSRGDVDDSLGNFTLSLIDGLDTLAVLGDIEEFERAVKLIIKDSRFDSDVVVSVFETNIRVLGGLLGGHIVSVYLKKKKKSMLWYNDELLTMAKEVGDRLLPAFNTTTGIPYPRINLKHGMQNDLSSRHRDTCTACAGTMILEFASLSRLTGDPVYEDKAHKAMDYLWQQRHRASDLVGTVINVHNGDWIRRESGVGAGIDSYYEYVLKAYILLGDDTYLDRFNKHYDAVMKYVSQGPLLVDVHMHRPKSTSRHFMDALLAFWPGLQVLKGDIGPAIETHEMLYQVMQKHNFLPEAFTTDFRVHWGQHPLRPEFVESTYFLYKATGDPYYLEVGKLVMENLNNHARVKCGFAALKDVTSGIHEDQMDSYVLAETFKYLYLLFAEKSDLVLEIDDYIFTTEAHLLPLSLSVYNSSSETPKIRREVYTQFTETIMDSPTPMEEEDEDAIMDSHHHTCRNPQYKAASNYAHNLRINLKNLVGKAPPPPISCPVKNDRPRLRAVDFIAGNQEQLARMHRMGIRIATMSDGRIQLLHTASEAASAEDAEAGMVFMQEMIELSKNQQQEPQHEPMTVQLISEPYNGKVSFRAGPAQFGYNLKSEEPIQGRVVVSEPYKACGPIQNANEMMGKIAILERGECMFVDKGRNLQIAGAIGGIVLDHTEGSTSDVQPLFAMSGDGKSDVLIPMVFLFHKEGLEVMDALTENPDLQVLLGAQPAPAANFEPPKETFDDPQTPELAIDPEGPSDSEGQSSSSEHSLKPDFPEPIDKPYDQTVATDQMSTSNQPQRVKIIQLSPLQPVQLGEDGQYRLESGTNEVHMKVKITKQPVMPVKPTVTDDDVIQLTTLPDGKKQLSFKLDQISKGAQPELNEIYVEVVHVLQDRTNFEQLANQADYLTAIARLLESAYFGMKTFDQRSQSLFEQLANELEIVRRDQPRKSKDTFSDQSEEAQRSQSQSESEESDQSLNTADEPDSQSESSEKDGRSQSNTGEFQFEGGSQFHHYASPHELNDVNEDEWSQVYDEKTGTLYINYDSSTDTKINPYEDETASIHRQSSEESPFLHVQKDPDSSQIFSEMSDILKSVREDLLKHQLQEERDCKSSTANFEQNIEVQSEESKTDVDVNNNDNIEIQGKGAIEDCSAKTSYSEDLSANIIQQTGQNLNQYVNSDVNSVHITAAESRESIHVMEAAESTESIQVIEKTQDTEKDLSQANNINSQKGGVLEDILKADTNLDKDVNIEKDFKSSIETDTDSSHKDNVNVEPAATEEDGL